MEEIESVDWTVGVNQTLARCLQPPASAASDVRFLLRLRHSLSRGLEGISLTGKGLCK